MSWASLAVSPAELLQLGGFLLGYLLVLLTPGPNMLAVGCLAAAQGMRGALPLILGIALGAGSLATLVLELAGLFTTQIGLARLVGAGLLLLVAWRLLQPPAIADPTMPPARHRFGLLAAGYLVAFGNPLTAAFFAAHFLGLGSNAALRPMLVAATMALALLVFLAVAAVLAQPVARRFAAAWAMQVRRVAATGLALAAAVMASSVLRPG